MTTYSLFLDSSETASATEVVGPANAVTAALAALQADVQDNADAAEAAALLASHYANDATDTDVPGGSPGERGAAYRVLQAEAFADAAATSATNANTAKTGAETALSQVNTSVGMITVSYLGSKTANPTTNNSGGALIVGALYFNSVSGEMLVWNGSNWLAAYTDLGDAVSKTGDTMTGDLVLVGNPTSPLMAAPKQYVDLREPAIAAGTTSQFWRGDKTWQAIAGGSPWTSMGTGSPSAAASYTFSSIGATYEDILLLADVTASAASNLQFEMSNDGTAWSNVVTLGPYGTGHQLSLSVFKYQSGNGVVITAATAGASNNTISQTGSTYAYKIAGGIQHIRIKSSSGTITGTLNLYGRK